MKKLACLFVLYVTCGIHNADAEELVIHDGQIKIATSADQEIFPKKWHSARINANAELLAVEEHERSKTVLIAAMEKYPEQILTDNLEAIYVLRRLRFFGISAGGTNSLRRIYISNRGADSGFTDTWMEGVFHAEFSSILKRNFSVNFDTQSWKAINEKDFEYGVSGVQAVRDKKARKRMDSKLYDAGFLFEYAQSTVENDFNSIAEKLFVGSNEFWEVVEKHERVRKKTNIVISFYEQVHPSFDENFFQSLTKKNDATLETEKRTNR